MFYVFAGFLLWTAWSLLRSDDDPRDPAAARDQEPATVRLLYRVLPTTPT